MFLVFFFFITSVLSSNLVPSLLRPEAPVRGQVCGQSLGGGGGSGEAAAWPDVGGSPSHAVAPRGPAGGGHEGEG